MESLMWLLRRLGSEEKERAEKMCYFVVSGRGNMVPKQLQ